MITIKDR